MLPVKERKEGVGDVSINLFRQFLSENLGKVIGGLIALIIGLCILLIGFWESLMLFACVALGIYLGRMFDRHEGLQGVLQRFWPKGD